jgi:uncharacterized protein YggT (Ycf19 family)
VGKKSHIPLRQYEYNQATDKYKEKQVMVTRLVLGLINFFLALAEILLGLRIILRFFAANPNNHFVSWVYNSSDVLLQPFRGIFPTAVIGRDHVIDFSAIFAMVVYGLLALAFTALANWLTPAPVVATTTKKRV